MSSKGNKVVPVRMDPELLSAALVTIQTRNIFTTEQPWTFSDFVRVALVEKMKKMERSRRPRSRKHLAGPPAIQS